LWFC